MKTKTKIFLGLSSTVIAFATLMNIFFSSGLELYFSVAISIAGLIWASIFISDTIEIIIYRFAILIDTLINKRFN